MQTCSFHYIIVANLHFEGDQKLWNKRAAYKWLNQRMKSEKKRIEFPNALWSNWGITVSVVWETITLAANDSKLFKNAS